NPAAPHGLLRLSPLRISSMSDPLPKYWQSLAERAGALPEHTRNEFPEELPVGVAAVTPDASSRRDFFKVMGLSAAAAMVACQRTAWAALDGKVKDGLRQAAESGMPIRVVLPWVMGPTAEAAVKRFLAAYPTARTVRYEPLGELAAIGEAHRVTHGVRAVPD